VSKQFHWWWNVKRQSRKSRLHVEYRLITWDGIQPCLATLLPAFHYDDIDAPHLLYVRNTFPVLDYKTLVVWISSYPWHLIVLLTSFLPPRINISQRYAWTRTEMYRVELIHTIQGFLICGPTPVLIEWHDLLERKQSTSYIMLFEKICYIFGSLKVFIIICQDIYKWTSRPGKRCFAI
jgi:hypothetical protein